MEEYGKVEKVRIKRGRYGYQQQRAICFSNEKEATIAIKETNKYKRWKAEEYKNVSQSKIYPENKCNEYNLKEYQKHKSHEKQRQNNSEVNNSVLRVQQDTNECNETTVKETEGYDKNSVRKDIINLKNDMQEIKEALKSLLTKQWQSKHEQEILYQPGQKETNDTRQYIEGNNPKEINSNQQKKENKTKPKKDILSDDMTENKENKEQPSKRQKKRCKGKVQEIKKDKKQTQRLQIYYENVRGLKSKIDSLAETIDDYEPTLICLVETHLLKEEQIQIPGYKIFRNDGTNNSRGILIAIKEKLKTIVVEVNREEEIGQTLWVLLNNQKTQVRMRVIYGPQENVTPNSELKKLYESISDQVDIGKENNQQIIILGDFNAKIGNYIKNNKETITKGGRHLKRLVGKQNLCIVNGESNKCEGLWTREQGEEKSVIDYVITTKKDLNTIKTMKIDEEKEFGIYNVEIQATKQCRKVYSNHNAIMLDISKEQEIHKRKTNK